MDNKLYYFFWDCGRQGTIDGLFIATEEEIKEAIGKEVYLGEVLGKHSDVYGCLEQNDLKEIPVPKNCLDKLRAVFNSTTLCGYNPLAYLQDDEDFDDDKFYLDDDDDDEEELE